MIGLGWAVIARGDPLEIERRMRAIYEGHEIDFAIAPGRADWHVVYSTGHSDGEINLAEMLAKGGNEVVYALTLDVDFPYALAVRSDGSIVDEDYDDPDGLAESLGCKLPWPKRPIDTTPTPDMRTVALLEGIGVEDARAAYQSARPKPPPLILHFQAVPGGVILYGDRGNIGAADIDISEAQPEVTVYSVTTSPQLDPFFVRILRGGGAVAHFDVPPHRDPFAPPVDEVKGAREPEAVLAALGITRAHFGF